MDSNSKNKLWNSKCTDKKGECLELFLDKNRLNVANISISKLKYIPKKTAMIDVTLAGDNVNIRDWHFPVEDSHSDHPFIIFKVEVGHPAHSTVAKTVPKLKNIDKNKYLIKLEQKVTELENEWQKISSAQGLDNLLDKFTNAITDSARQSKLDKSKISQSKLDFWSEELLNFKIKLRSAK